MPGQSGKIVATFMSTRTSAAAGKRLVDVERAHGHVHREQLPDPADRLQHDREQRRPRVAHHAEPAARHGDQPTSRAEVVRRPRVAHARADDREPEQDDAESGHDQQAR